MVSMAAMTQGFHKKPQSLGRRRFLEGAIGASLLPARVLAAPSSPPETVLVVGAGLAGLAAALRLREARRQVIVVEARNAPGGRVRTLRNLRSEERRGGKGGRARGAPEQ